MRRALAALLLAALGAARATDPLVAAFALMDEGHPLAAVRLIERDVFAVADPAAAPAFDEWQQWGATLAEITPTVALATPAPAPDPASLAGVTLTDALPAIVARARQTRIVILNEGHATPRDRAFALEVARALRPLGYRTLALETLNNAADDRQSAAMMATLMHDGFARRMTGVYLRDPAYGDFLRQALSLGYRPVSYEQARPYAGMDAREEDQAQFLARRAVPRGPAGGKLLIYVGYGHVAEGTVHDGTTRLLPMAARLKAKTGIDPLTIDQSTFAGEHPGSTADQAYHRLPTPDRPAALMKAGRPFVWGGNAGNVDVQVVHPPMRLVDGRPDWLLTMGRRPSPIPPALLPTHGIRLVQAFLANEAPDAIPIDQVLVTAGRPAPALMLPPGKPVRYAVEDDPGDPPLHAAHQ